MARVNKYEYLNVVQGNYGHGWEDVSCSSIWEDAFYDLTTYRKEDPDNRYRLVRRRVPNAVQTTQPVEPTRASLNITDHDLGQLIDGLNTLIDDWTATATYMETGEVQTDANVRECSSADEATRIAAHYTRIRDSLRPQDTRLGGTVTITIRLGNDAFQEDPYAEIERITGEATFRLRSIGLIGNTSGAEFLQDENGSQCGTLSYSTFMVHDPE